MKLNLKTWIIILAIVVIAVVVYLTQSNKTPEAKSVGITQIVEHPSLDAVRQGILDKLQEEGYTQGENLTVYYESAQGNPTISRQIADKFIADNPSVVVGISTPSAQSLAAATSSIPVVFSAVTDPIAAGLISDFKKPGGNITGVSDLTPIFEHVDLVQKIVPNVKKLGVIYNSGEANSVSIVALLDDKQSQGGPSIVKAVVAKTSDVRQATQSLVGKVDAIYIPTDNTVVSAIESVLKVAIANKIPVFAGDEATVEKGSIATLSFDYYDIGVQTGEIILDIFDGKAVGDISSKYIEDTSLVVNPKAALSFGITLDTDLISSAGRVIE